MSTRYLQHLFKTKTLIVWAPDAEMQSEANRWHQWFENESSKAQTAVWTDPIEPYNASLHTTSPVLCLLAEPSALLSHTQDAAQAGWPLIVLLKQTPERTPRAIREALAQLKATTTSRIIGPDCSTLVIPHLQLANPPASWPSLPMPTIRPGSIAVLCQSPSIATCVRDWVAGRHIGLSHLICVGGSVDVNIADLVDPLIQDPHCHALAIQIDRLRIPARFISAIRSCSRHKPVMVLHTGRVREFQTEQDPEAPDFLDRELLYQAAIARAGASSLNTLDDLFQSLESLNKRRTHDGQRLLILGAGDGLEALAADHLYEAFEGRQDFQIRKEPSWFDHPEQLPSDPDTLSDLRETADGLLIPIVAERLWSDTVSFAAWADRFQRFEAQLNRPLYLAVPGMILGKALREALDQAGLAVYTTPEQALNGFLSLARHEVANRLVDAHVDGNDLDALRPAEQWFRDRTDASERLSASERQAVATRLPGFESHPVSGANPVRVAAGISRDPIFGPVIFVHQPPGHFPALAVTLPPINQALAEDLLHRSATGRVLETSDPQGFAGAALALVSCSRLLSRVPEIVTLRVNLAIARGQVQANLDELSLGERSQPAITPYPESLDRPVQLTDGRTARLRPLRPEDEDAHRVFLSKLSRATLRFRYFSDKQSFSARELAAMTHVDYSREVALIVSVPTDDAFETLGVIRVIFDADLLSAEFAMVVRDDLQRTGVGRLLLQAAVDLARDRGARLIYGETMIQNKGMQGLARALGFKVSTDFDAECVWMRMQLAPPQDDWEASRLALIGA